MERPLKTSSHLIDPRSDVRDRPGCWQDILHGSLHSGAEFPLIEGFALEQVIDLHRAAESRTGAKG